MKIRVGLAQLCSVSGDLAGNCARIEALARRAAAAGCAAVFFPELSDTGYAMDVVRKRAAPWSGAPFLSLQRAAAAAKIHLFCGLSEREGERIFNSLAVLAPDGRLLGHYRKTHLFSADPVHEERCFTPGRALVGVDVQGLRWGLSICFDLRFPELYRTLALDGAEVLVNCSAWPQARAGHWDLLSRARAVENQAWFLGVNRAGEDHGLRFCGRSRVVDPEGRVVAEAGCTDEELLVAEIDPETLSRFRQRLPALAARRPDLYGNPGRNSG